MTDRESVPVGRFDLSVLASMAVPAHTYMLGTGMVARLPLAQVPLRRNDIPDKLRTMWCTCP